MPSQKQAYQQVTNKIIEYLESGQADGKWQAPWIGAQAPISIRGNRYHGINIPLLWAAGYTDPRWGTYKAWKEQGAQVQKGQKGTQIIFWKFQSIEETNDNGEPETKTIPLIRFYTVFNAQQVKDAPELPNGASNLEESNNLIENYTQSEGIGLETHPSKAAYSPQTDTIMLPSQEAFHNTEGYYSTAFHEMAHSTGSPNRLNRDLSGRFGSESYAAEELIAELGAAFLASHMGVSPEPREDHAKYIRAWLRILRNDNKAIFTAAKQAQTAADYILAYTDTSTSTNEEAA